MGLDRTMTSGCGGTYRVTMRGSEEAPVPRKTAAAVVTRDGRLLTVRLEDPTTRVVASFLPGGKIEGFETPAQAAVRELFEETGFRGRVDSDVTRVHQCHFVWDGVLYDRQTRLFRVRLLGDTPAPVNDASYHRGVEWIELDRVGETLSHIPGFAELVIEVAADR